MDELGEGGMGTVFLAQQHAPLRRRVAVSLLGGSLLGQARYAEAEPLLVSGYEGMKAREQEIDAMWRHLLTDAGERVVRLYEELGDPDQVTGWRARVGMP